MSRATFRTQAAEAVAVLADVYEEDAAALRPTDPATAKELGKLATHLRKHARGVERFERGAKFRARCQRAAARFPRHPRAEPRVRAIQADDARIKAMFDITC